MVFNHTSLRPLPGFGLFLGKTKVLSCFWSFPLFNHTAYGQLSHLIFDEFISQHTDDDNQHEESDFFQMAETTFVVWFTLEYIIRFTVSPKKVGENIF